MKKWLIFFLTAVFVFCFSACGEEEYFRYDIGKKPKNLDPQMAYDTASQIILSHVMQGLVKENESGNIVCDAALEYNVSGDGKVYTFVLQKALKWSDGSQVVAEDFAFALKRIFFKETLTPNKSAFLCIKNAQSIVDGDKDIDSLGVRALSDIVLEIELESKNPRFLYTLATTAAYPCDEEFFYSTKGKYGYNAEQLLFNGHYVISKVTDNYIQLFPNSKSTYYRERKNTSVVFYTNSSYDAQARFLDGVTDFAQVSQSDVSKLDSKKFEYFGFESSTWVLGFNQNNELFKNQTLRKAMFGAICEIKPNVNGVAHYKFANGLIVPSIEIDGASYRSLVGNLSVSAKGEPKELLNLALKELKRKNVGKLTLLCPNQDIFKYYVTYIQKAWNEKLGIIVNFISPDYEEYYKALYSGDFDLAIFPISATDNSVLTQLDKLSTQSSYNYLYYDSEIYNNSIDEVAKVSSVDEIVKCAFSAEQYLIDEAVILPLLFEESYVAINKNNSGISYSPFGPTVNFKNAYKK